ATDLQRRLFEVVETEPDSARAAPRLREMLSASMASWTEAERRQAPDTAALIQAQLTQLNTPWLRGFLSLDPREALRRVRCPAPPRAVGARARPGRGAGGIKDPRGPRRGHPARDRAGAARGRHPRRHGA